MTIEKRSFTKAVKPIFASVIFAVSLVISMLLPLYSEKFDQTAMLELTFLLAFGAVAGFSWLFCIVTGFNMVKFASLSVVIDVVIYLIRSFMDWFTSLELTSGNGREVFISCLKNNLLLYILILATVIAFGLIVSHKQKLRA